MTLNLRDTSAWAIRKVNLQGLVIPETPAFEQPQLPADITSVHASELMQLFSEFISWLDYIEVQLAAAQIDEKHEENILEEMQAGLQIDNSGEKTVTLVKAKVFKDEDFQDQREKVLKAYSYRRVIETIFNRLDRGRFLVSREVTRRSYGTD